MSEERMGWVCPRCEIVKAPSETECHCVKSKGGLDSTYNPSVAERMIFKDYMFDACCLPGGSGGCGCERNNNVTCGCSDTNS